jgi:DnaJ-class molecular chaperone
MVALSALPNFLYPDTTNVKSPPHRRHPLENPYQILGVSPTATTEEIKKAYRSLAMRHHPDRSTHSNSEIRFNAIKTAYELLSDPKKRAEYNQSLNNRIIIDSESEARALWLSLFDRCGVAAPHDHH